jgi:hypothetical protein
MPASIVFVPAWELVAGSRLEFVCGSFEQPTPAATNERTAAIAANRCCEVMSSGTNAERGLDVVSSSTRR